VEGVGENLWGPVPSCSKADFDVRREHKCPKGEKGKEMPFSLEKKLAFEHPIPDGEFKFVQLDDNPARKVMIGANLLPMVENDLIECLQANTDLFVCSPNKC
jgi:hypothetical protein